MAAMATGLTDEALRARLQRHNYACPPITETTRAVLVKKLAQLDRESQARSRTNGKPRDLAAQTQGRQGVPGLRGRNRPPPTRLIDYSSAEEESGSAPATPNHSAEPFPGLRQRRISATQRNRRAQTNGCGGTESAGPSHRLLQYSDEEDGVEDEEEIDDDDEEDDSDQEVDDDLEDDDDEEEDDDDEEDEDEVMFNNRVNFAGQTSPELDNSNSLEPLRLVNGNSDQTASSFRSRFASSTPQVGVKSTASFLSTSQSTSPSTSTPNAATSYSRSLGLNSPHLRRSIASSREFGSLGEALSTVPNHSSHNGYSSSPLTQASPAAGPSIPRGSKTAASGIPALNQNESNKRLFFLFSVQNVSLLIMGMAIVFLAVIGARYSSLKPSTDIRDRIPLCPGSPQDAEHSCASDADVDDLIRIYNLFLDKLEARGEEFLCRPDELGLQNAAISVSELLPLIEPSEAATADLLLRILCDKPHWGIRLLDSSFDETRDKVNVRHLVATHPSLDWSCWITRTLGSAFLFSKAVTMYLCYAAILGIFSYIVYRLYVYYKERKVQEQQEVFELVEQVLSLLVTHQQMARNGAMARAPGLAVDHIRDELISPVNRHRKRRVWQKVVKYISESESRVKEDQQLMDGVQVRVWHWLPDRLTWKPSPGSPPPLNPHGPNPYVMAAAAAAAHAPSAPPPPSPPVTPSGGHHSTWQGSAFNSLNSNVASPPVPPTPCLKVRNLFDTRAKVSGPGWVWQVKEEVLRRCAPTAKVLHIAVDTDSPDGCVYIKCATLEDAGRVFKTLHGQWYRGTLVTAKYLRLERYHERFPAAKYQTEPLAAKN